MRRYALDHRSRGDGYDEPSGLDRTLYSRGRLPLIQTARESMARRARETGRREDEPAVREEAVRRQRQRVLDDLAYPYSFDPMGPDGAPVWGTVGHDSRVVYEPDSEALREPDPSTYPNDTAPLLGAFEFDLLGRLDLLDRDNGHLGVL